MNTLSFNSMNLYPSIFNAVPEVCNMYSELILMNFIPAKYGRVYWLNMKKIFEYCILLTAYAVPVHSVECVRTSGKGALVFVGLKSPDGQ